jgi:hypothetical protein
MISGEILGKEIEFVYRYRIWVVQQREQQMGPIDILLNQVVYSNRKRVKDDIKKLCDNYKTLSPSIGGLSEFLLFLLLQDSFLYYFEFFIFQFIIMVRKQKSLN